MSCCCTCHCKPIVTNCNNVQLGAGTLLQYISKKGWASDWGARNRNRCQHQPAAVLSYPWHCTGGRNYREDSRSCATTSGRATCRKTAREERKEGASGKRGLDELVIFIAVASTHAKPSYARRGSSTQKKARPFGKRRVDTSDGSRTAHI